MGDQPEESKTQKQDAGGVIMGHIKRCLDGLEVLQKNQLAQNALHSKDMDKIMSELVNLGRELGTVIAETDLRQIRKAREDQEHEDWTAIYKKIGKWGMIASAIGFLSGLGSFWFWKLVFGG